jgi:mRNA export factor
LASNSVSQIGQHEAPVKSIFWAKDAQALVTGSWDRTVCAWDCRTPTPQIKIPLSEKVWAMDLKWPWLIVGTADRKIHMYNMTNPGTPFRVCWMHE